MFERFFKKKEIKIPISLDVVLDETHMGVGACDISTAERLVNTPGYIPAIPLLRDSEEGRKMSYEQVEDLRRRGIYA